MIHYSIIPLETVFENFEQMEKQQLQEITINGVTMVVEPLEGREAKIVRLISPNPQDYLNPQLAPGQKIIFHPDFS